MDSVVKTALLERLDRLQTLAERDGDDEWFDTQIATLEANKAEAQQVRADIATIQALLGDA